MLLGDQRAHVVAGVGAGADFHFGNLDLQAFDHGVCRGFTHRHHQGNGHAAFTAGAIGGTHEGVDGVGNVGVGHDHGVVFSATQSLHPLAMGAARGVDVLGNGGGAHEADGGHARVGEQRVHGFFVTVHHVQHTRWQAGLQGQFSHQQSAAGVALRGFQDEGVAAGHGHGPHPQRHHHGEVERGDAGGDAQALKLAPRVDVGADVFAVLAFEQLRRVRGVFDVFNAALQLAHGVAQHFAVLGGDQRANFVGVVFQQNFELAHDAGAFERRRGAPSGVGRLGAGNGEFHGELVSQQNALFGQAGGGVEHVLRAGAAVDELAVNQVLDGGQCGHECEFSQAVS